MTGIKTGGRTKGTPNKTTKTTSELRNKINLLLENKFDTINDLLDKLQPKEQIEILIKLLPYSIPKLNNIEMTFEQEPDLEQECTPEQIKELKDLILRMEC